MDKIEFQHQKIADKYKSPGSGNSFRNRSFKPPSPLFLHQNSSYENATCKPKVINEILYRRSSINRSSRRTSTPIFTSAELDAYEHQEKLKLDSTNSLTSSQSRSISTNSSPKVPSKKRSSSSFMKKLNNRFRSNSTSQSNEGRQLNESFSSNNKYGSINDSLDQDTTFRANYSNSSQRPKLATIGTQTPDIIRKSPIPNMNSNVTNHTSITSSGKSAGLVNQDTLDLEALRKVFNVFDMDHDGSITIEDVENVMNSLQHLKDEIEMPSVSQIKIAFEKFDTNKNGSIEFDEFLEILRCAGAQNASNETSGNDIQLKISSNDQKAETKGVKTNMRIIFEQFDKDNDGKIDKPELNFVMQNLFPDEVITGKDIDDMLREADLDQNGFIDFDEFANMFLFYTTNTAVAQSCGEQSFISITSTSSANNSTPRKNASVTNLHNTDTIKSKKSFSKPASRSSSNDPTQQPRSRHVSGSSSPNNFKKLFIASQMMDLKAAFHMFDKNGDSKISEKELYEVMNYLGLKATLEDAKAMIKVVDKNQNGCVDYDEFIQMMTKTQLKPLSQEEELRKTFNIFDIDGNGFITQDEIKKTMDHLGEKISDAEVLDMIRAADKNGDGLIDINEFSGLLNGTNVFKA